jgi:hypothetical protein
VQTLIRAKQAMSRTISIDLIVPINKAQTSPPLVFLMVIIVVPGTTLVGTSCRQIDSADGRRARSPPVPSYYKSTPRAKYHVYVQTKCVQRNATVDLRECSESSILHSTMRSIYLRQRNFAPCHYLPDYSSAKRLLSCRH